MIDIYEEEISLKQMKKTGVLLSVFDRKGQGPANVGKKLLLNEDGEEISIVSELQAILYNKKDHKHMSKKWSI